MSVSKEISFKEQVKKSFSACKEDIAELKTNNLHFKQVIEQLHSQNEYKDSIIQTLQSQISTMQQTQTNLLQEIQMIREEFSSIKQTNQTQKLNQVEEKTNTTVKNPSSRQAQSLNSTPEKVVKKDPYEALLEFKAKTNKRELVKQKILTTVPNEGMILSELRFLFVDHFNYCSKATFYNYLKELEFSKQIRIERENSKNIVYLQGVSNPMNSKEQFNSQFNI